ncbi:MAG: BrnT family toxin, partial [Candidatus Xenobia bacterium]
MDEWDGKTEKEEPVVIDVSGGFDWSDQKEQINIAKHGVDFEEAMQAVCSAERVMPAQTVAGEPRQAVEGWSGGRKLLVIITRREGIIRII